MTTAAIDTNKTAPIAPPIMAGLLLLVSVPPLMVGLLVSVPPIIGELLLLVSVPPIIGELLLLVSADAGIVAVCACVVVWKSVACACVVVWKSVACACVVVWKSVACACVVVWKSVACVVSTGGKGSSISTTMRGLYVCDFFLFCVCYYDCLPLNLPLHSSL